MWNVRTRLGALTVALALATTACGGIGDSTSDDAEKPTDNVTTQASDSPDGDAIVPLTAAEICAKLVPADVGAALGVEVTEAVAGDQSTPQCAYSYTNTTGATSNLTVASMRPEDLAGRSGAEAFDYVLDLNRGLASGTDVDEEELSAGDRAIRLSGGSLHLGIVSSGGHLLTIIVPFKDAAPAAVNTLIEKAAEVFA